MTPSATMADVQDDTVDDIIVESADGRLSASVRIEGAAWDDAAPAETAQRVLQAFARVRGAPGARCELDIALISDADVAELNAAWRGKAGATNVLSFPSGESWAGSSACHLGSVLLASGVVRKEAAERGIGFADHTAHLILHGLLHLLGHDHETDGERIVMEAIEVEVLAGLAIANPYGED